MRYYCNIGSLDEHGKFSTAMFYFTDRLFVDADLRVGAIICAGAIFLQFLGSGNLNFFC